MPENVLYDFSLFTEYDIHLFREGKHFLLWEKLGAHFTETKGKAGVYFAVWAPDAQAVHVSGSFNDWNKYSHPLGSRGDSSGIWEGFVSDVLPGDVYKYVITTKDNRLLEKADPLAFRSELPPATGSVVWENDYEWTDGDWMQGRTVRDTHGAMSIYEVHIGSWGRHNAANKFFSYRELADNLVAYVKDMGFTHVEFLPVMEHPFYGSWGYQVTSFFAPTSRFGTSHDLMFLIDMLHHAGIGVILDWVPSHFPGDAHALFAFDGSHLYEHADMRLGFHPDWNSYIFNYGRFEVKSFLISSAMFWTEVFHADALRVDAVASMLYLDYSRKEGEWLPNIYGGNENLEAIQFLKEMNSALHARNPGVLTMAEESTAWPGVTRPAEEGGLGFDRKWMMGWMHDTLRYFGREPIFRKFHQDELTFSLWYAGSEKFLLPLSHDEVVHGKASLVYKMPGDEWHRFANLRLLFGYMFLHPFPKLLFMGSEFGHTGEWQHDSGLDWHLTEFMIHKGVQHLVRDLNTLYVKQPSLYERDFEDSGFRWLDLYHRDDCVLCWERRAHDEADHLVVAANFDQNTFYERRIPVTGAAAYTEILSTDDARYNGSGIRNPGILQAEEGEDGANYIVITLPPLSLLVFRPVET